MLVPHVAPVTQPAVPQARSAWHGLYRAGAAAAVLYAVLIIIPLVLLSSMPQPPTAGGAELLTYIASYKPVYIAELVSFVGLSLPAIVVFLALYAALEPLDRSVAAIGCLIGIASETIALAYNSSPPSLNTGLLVLSGQYVTATGDVQRTALATAAEGLMALTNGVNSAGILTALGILITSLAMRKGLFPSGVAILGIATGALGIVSEVLRDVIGPAYLAYGVLLPTWFLAVGWKLHRLSNE